MPLGMEAGLGQGHIVLDGDPAPPSKKAQPQFSAYVYCGQTAGWIKMALSMEVGLGPGHIVLDGEPRKKAQQPVLFSAHVYCGHGRSCFSQFVVNSSEIVFVASES